jgi:two-component system, OmpR family, sensor histidine kinase AdeS
MRGVGGLGRQIVLSMVVATIASVLLTIVGLYTFYGVVIRMAPHLLPMTHHWMPSQIEWLVILALCLAAATRRSVGGEDRRRAGVDRR